MFVAQYFGDAVTHLKTTIFLSV